jgi:transposase-like protein
MSDPGFASSNALARFRLLQPHLEQDIPLARIAAESGIAERTLHRWLAAWRTHGIGGLEQARRSDGGTARRLAPEIEALVRSLATRRPRPTAAAIHRKVHAEAVAQGLAAPSYSVVAGIVRGIEPARIAAATDAAALPARPTATSASVMDDPASVRRVPPPLRGLPESVRLRPDQADQSGYRGRHRRLPWILLHRACFQHAQDHQ